MKITDRQLLWLMDILKDSMRMNVVGMFAVSYKARQDLYNEIMNQQSSELFEIKGDE